MLFRVGEENPLMVFVVHRETGRSTRGDIPYVKKKKKKRVLEFLLSLGEIFPGVEKNIKTDVSSLKSG